MPVATQQLVSLGFLFFSPKVSGGRSRSPHPKCVRDTETVIQRFDLHFSGIAAFVKCGLDNWWKIKCVLIIIVYYYSVFKKNDIKKKNPDLYFP